MIYSILTIANKNWTWNGNPIYTPSYTNWAEQEPNLSPIVVDPQYVKIQQDTWSDKIGGKWFVEQDVTTGNTNFICQSPKVTKASSSASIILNQLWLTILLVASVYIFIKMLI